MSPWHFRISSAVQLFGSFPFSHFLAALLIALTSLVWYLTGRGGYSSFCSATSAARFPDSNMAPKVGPILGSP